MSKKVIIIFGIVMLFIVGVWGFKQFKTDKSQNIIFENSNLIPLNIQNNHPRLQFSVNNDELIKVLSSLGIRPNSFYKNNSRVNRIEVAISNEIYSQTQSIDPNSGIIFISSESSFNQGVLYVRIGLDDEVRLPDGGTTEKSFNRLVLNYMVNELFMGYPNSEYQSTLSGAERFGVDLLKDPNNYEISVFENIKIK